MLRLPPFDKIGTTPAPDFVNADPTNSVPGSIVNGQVFNQLQHEGENLELLAGLPPSGTDLTQWAQAASRRGIWCGTLTGTGDLAVATLGAVLPALLQGMGVGAVASAANTVTNPKLRVTNVGSASLFQDFPILKEDGSALAVGEIVAGRRYRYEADGAGNVLISGGGISGGSATNVAQAAKALFNVQKQVVQTRTSANSSTAGQNIVVLSGLSYVKKSATSVILAWLTFQTYTPGTTGAITMRLSVGSGFADVGLTNGYTPSGSSQPIQLANTPVLSIAGVGAGTQAISLAFRRDDNGNWTTVLNPTSADVSGYPTPNTLTLIIAEVEP